MSGQYDVVVIGAGLGGLTAAALLARAGRKVLVLERNHSVGGAATTYKLGDLMVESSLHETTDPHHPLDPKHRILSRLGVLDAVQWVPVGLFYEVRGGPVGAPFRLPDGFAAARAALQERFSLSRDKIDAVLTDMESVAAGLGVLSRGREAFRNPREGFAALSKLGPVLRDWRRSLAEVFERAFGGDEAIKCALAANLGYYHDDPHRLWWIFFAVAQGGYLACGGRYVRGGSQQLSDALARVISDAGGEIRIERTATEIELDGGGRPTAVVHRASHGRDREVVQTRAVAGNAAPSVLAEMLPEHAQSRLLAAYGRRPLSISLFAAVYGLSRPPREFGVRAYSNFLLPQWMTRLADYRRCADLLGGVPETAPAPVLTVVDYSAIASGLGGPPYPVSVVGVDRVENWSGLDTAAYDAKRKRWLDRLARVIDEEFPGFAASIVASSLSTARSMKSYLNAPGGSIYGFAPLPPRTPIWRGVARSPKTPVPGLYLASSYAGSGGFTGAIMGGAAAAERILAER
jgi:phytoene dehydrogenase-like protein